MASMPRMTSSVYIARKTREDIIRRTIAGRERARANRVRFGRRPKLSLAEQQDVRERIAAGEHLRAIARTYDVSASTISRLGQCQTQVRDNSAASPAGA